MSLTAPNVFVQVGDSDYLDVTANKSLFMGVDSRLRELRRDYSGANWRSTMCKGLRTPSVANLYAEFSPLHFGSAADPAGSIFGICHSTQLGTQVGNYVGAIASSYSYQASGNLWNAATLQQAGLSTIAVGDKIGAMFYSENGTGYVRFLKNGRVNLIGMSEDFGHAAWQKLNSATAVGQRITFVTNTSYVQQAIPNMGTSGADPQVSISFYVTSSNTTSFAIITGDNADGVPIYTQVVPVTANVRTRVSFTQSMGIGAGFGGNMAVLIAANGVATAGTVLKIEEFQVNTGTTAAPYQKRTDTSGGGSCGNPLALTAGAYALALSNYYLDTKARVDVDKDDLLYMPSFCQPWGSSARVADCGGNTPTATKFTASIGASAATFDAYGRVATSAGTSDMIICNNAPNHAGKPGFVHFEMHLEVAGVYGGMIGLAIRNHVSNIYSFPGHSAQSWGYYGSTGEKYHAAVATAYGSTYNVTGTVVGCIWQPSTGKVWFHENGVIQGGGDPIAGTGAAFTNVTGDIVPCISVYGARTRIRTHACEQLYRPDYCDAWDGGKLLSEQHYANALAGDTEITSQVYFPFPWGGSKASEAPIGAIILANESGYYDRLPNYNLRNQNVTVNYYLDNYSTNGAVCLIDNAKHDGTRACRIITRDPRAVLDVRLDEMPLVRGIVGRAPVIPVQGVANKWDVANTALAAFSGMTDGGFGVSTYAFYAVATSDPAAHKLSFRRTVNPALLQTVTDLQQFKEEARFTGLNFTLNAWTGNTPNSWTKTEVGGGTITSAGGTAARIQGAGTVGSYAGIHQNGITDPVTGSTDFDGTYFIALNITVNTSGNLLVAFEEVQGAAVSGGTAATAQTSINGGGTGWYFVKLVAADPSLDFLSIYSLRAGGTVDLTVNEVIIIRATAYAPETAILTAAGIRYTTNYDNAGQLRCAGGLTNALLSYWSDDRPTLRQVMDLEPGFFDVYADEQGLWQKVYLTEPEAVLTTDIAYLGALYVQDYATGNVEVEDELSPALTDRFGYRPNFAPHKETDIAGAIKATTTASYLEAEFLENKLAYPGGAATDAKAFDPFYSHGAGANYVKRYDYGVANTSPTPGGGKDNDAIRIHRYAGVRRRFYTVEVPLEVVLAKRIRPGGVMDWFHTRHDLAAGKRVQIQKMVRRLLKPTVLIRAVG